MKTVTLEQQERFGCTFTSPNLKTFYCIFHKWTKAGRHSCCFPGIGFTSVRNGDITKFPPTWKDVNDMSECPKLKSAKRHQDLLNAPDRMILRGTCCIPFAKCSEAGDDASA